MKKKRKRLCEVKKIKQAEISQQPARGLREGPGDIAHSTQSDSCPAMTLVEAATL